MAGLNNLLLETMLRTLSGAFSPQIVSALGDILVVVKQYDERLERVEKMVGELLLRDRATYVVPAIEDKSDARTS